MPLSGEGRQWRANPWQMQLLKTNSGLESASTWIKGTLGRLFGKKAILLILVNVYRKIYPGNMIQQIILLKIEKTS